MVYNLSATMSSAYDPSAKYSKSDLLRLARAFGVSTSTKLSKGKYKPKSKTALSTNVAAAARTGRMDAAKWYTTFRPDGMEKYSMENLKFFAKQMKVPVTVDGKRKKKEELLAHLTMKAKGVPLPASAMPKPRKTPRRARSASPAGARRPRAASPARRPRSAPSRRPRASPAPTPVSLRPKGPRPRSAGTTPFTGRARLTSNVGPVSGMNGVAMRRMFDDSRPRGRAAPASATPMMTPSSATITPSALMSAPPAAGRRQQQMRTALSTPLPTVSPTPAPTRASQRQAGRQQRSAAASAAAAQMSRR